MKEVLKLAQQCVCGEPNSAGTHRTDGPCLAPQPEQEPVGEAYLCDLCKTPFGTDWQCPSCGHNMSTKEPVYIAPPQRAWVGLTDEEIVDAYDVAKVSFKRSQQGIRGQMLTSRDSPDWHYAKAIEAKLKEKNA